jgi:spermidine synthase
MFARMALPKLGGTPAVWNVCMVFYQALLLAGYTFSHQLAKRFMPRRTTGLQMAIVLAAFFALPIRLPQFQLSPLNDVPTLWLLTLLVVGMGVPFFALTTLSSTLQMWYTGTSHAGRGNPYFLYSASNLGSLLGLLAYPLLIERNLGLSEQSRLWGWGFVVLMALTTGCAFSLWFAPESRLHDVRKAEETGPQPTRLQELKWLAFAFIPSSLMLAVTTALTTELPPIPLLWVLPLAIYLLSFILVFARKRNNSQAAIVGSLPVLLILMAFMIASKFVFSPILSTLFYLTMLFFACLACHGALAISRPAPTFLTRFYLCVSIGGVLGGFFNAIVAPVVFKSIAELPIDLFLLGLAIPLMGLRAQKDSTNKWDLILPAALGLVVAVISVSLRSAPLRTNPILSVAFFATPFIVCFSFSNRPMRFALALGAILLASGLFIERYGRALLAERSFFGVYRVTEKEGYRQLIHGTTIHGIQSMDPARSREPLSYYSETGPIGQVFRTSAANSQFHEVAVIGLGAGSLACYNALSRQFTFYEIDPTVERIARNPRYFTFLRDCAPSAKIEIGDARLSLATSPSHKYDMIVIDAFSSDTVPMHLVTREATELYLDKLADRGLLAFNISNRYLDLKPVLGELARNKGLAAIVQEDSNISSYDQSRGKYGSTWVLLARQRSDFGTLASQPNWHDIPPGSRLWTDDYSSIAEIIRWN